MTLEKGAMVFHMLRWEMGDDTFQKFPARRCCRSTRTREFAAADLEKMAEAAEPAAADGVLRAVAGWDGRAGVHEQVFGVPAGEQQGLPDDRVDQRGPGPVPYAGGAADRDGRQDGGPAGGCVRARSRRLRWRRSDGRGRIQIDPENWMLKSTPDLAVRVAVLRGQQLVAQGDLTGALAEYQKALDSNKTSSLAAYRIGEVFFMQRNYQSAANSFRDSLRGDGDPTLDRGVEPHSPGVHLRRDRAARARGQRVPAGGADERQHAGRDQRGACADADSVQARAGGGLGAEPGEGFAGEAVEGGDGEVEVLLAGVFDLVVADAAQRLHEHHHGGDAGAGDFRGVMQRARGKAGASPARLRRWLHG